MKQVISGNRMTVFAGGKPYTINHDHPLFSKLRELVKSNDEEGFLRLVNLKNVAEVAVVEIGDNKVKYENGKVTYNGVELHGSIVSRIVELYKEGFSIDSMIVFLENLLQNPSRSSVQELYDFLENKNLPITEDGHFLAYKAVQDNYLDKHSGTVSNHVGAVIEMERNQVDDDRRNECSYGYHVGALEYSGPNGTFFNRGDRCIIVKVNPKDVVAVPKDYHCQKMRVCRYEVVGEYEAPLDSPVYGSRGETVQGNHTSSKEYLAFGEVVPGDVIDFVYVKADGTRTSRFGVYVEEVEDDRISGVEPGETHPKDFLKNGMSEIEFA